MCAVDMWRPLGCADSERFALVWESEELKALNNTLFNFVKNKVGPAVTGLISIGIRRHTQRRHHMQFGHTKSF